MKEIPLPRGSMPLLTLALAWLVLAFPRPTLVNLGAGDEPLARGFQAWERAGPDGRTMFRWSRDGSTIELPVQARGENVRARVRLARFEPNPVELTWRVNGRDAARQTVRPRGWHVETVDLGPIDGPLVLQLRSFDDTDALGAAIDWVELSGVRRLTPRSRAWWGLVLLVVIAPMMAGYIAGTRAGHLLGLTLLVLVPLVLWLDPGQGLAALIAAGGPVLVGLTVLALVSRFPGEYHEAFTGAAVATTVVLVALLHPSFFYPDVDTHARLLAAIRQDASLILDPSPYQQQTGAWTRTIAGAKVPFPYSPVFHVVAWPLALFLGEADAVKTLGAVAFGTSALLVYGLARHALLGPGTALLAQVLFATLPIESSRLFLALFPALFAQCLELALMTFLATHLSALTGRTLWLLAGMMAATQIAYTGSLPNVAVLVAALSGILWIRGERTTAIRLLAVAAATSVVVGLTLYGRFLPVLWTQVLPHAGGADPAAWWERTAWRAVHFFGLYLVFVVLGFVWTRPSATKDVLVAASMAGVFLLVLRGPLPALVRDVKEIELLAAPVAIFTAAAIPGMAKTPRFEYRAPLGGAALILWGLSMAALAYLANVFVAR